MKQTPLPGFMPTATTRQRLPVLCDPAYQRHSRTSEAAAVRIAPHTGTMGAKVFSFLEACPEGATDEEMQIAIPMNGNTQRPRRVALVRDGMVRDSGKTRPTIGGDQAVVWVAVL